MKKFGKFVLGCFGLVGQCILVGGPLVASCFLMILSVYWAFTFIISFPLALFLLRIAVDWECTDLFLSWVFGVEIE